MVSAVLYGGQLSSHDRASGCPRRMRQLKKLNSELRGATTLNDPLANLTIHSPEVSCIRLAWRNCLWEGCQPQSQ